MPTPITRVGLGTELNRDVAPWQSYDRDMDVSRGWSDRLKADVEAYSKRRHTTKPSNQALEELCRQREMSNEAVKDYKFDDQDEIIRLKDARVGKIMSVFKFWELLQTIIPCYIASTVRNGLAGLAVLMPTTDGSQWTYVCGIQVGWMHEYSEFWLDAHGLPLNEKWRGWRGTVLFRLITGGFISEADAHCVFGEPTGAASRLYRERLFYYRNRRHLKSLDDVVAELK